MADAHGRRVGIRMIVLSIGSHNKNDDGGNGKKKTENHMHRLLGLVSEPRAAATGSRSPAGFLKVACQSPQGTDSIAGGTATGSRIEYLFDPEWVEFNFAP